MSPFQNIIIFFNVEFKDKPGSSGIGSVYFKEARDFHDMRTAKYFIRR